MGANAELVKLMGPQLELLLPVLDEKARRLALGAVDGAVCRHLRRALLGYLRYSTP